MLFYKFNHNICSSLIYSAWWTDMPAFMQGWRYFDISSKSSFSRKSDFGYHLHLVLIYTTKLNIHCHLWRHLSPLCRPPIIFDKRIQTAEVFFFVIWYLLWTYVTDWLQCFTCHCAVEKAPAPAAGEVQSGEWTWSRTKLSHWKILTC